MEKQIIWSNYNLDYSDWKADLEENYPDISEEERMELMYELNAEYLEDERINLNIDMDNEIVAIADIGRWNGTFHGYKRVGTIRDCLYSTCDFAEFYVDKNGDLCCDETHHDGTNHIIFRAYRKNVTESQKVRFEELIFNRSETDADIRKYTRSLGSVISKVYGWKKAV